MNHRAFAFVFARGGSKGVPRKNIKLLGGKPLIAYAIETALASGVFESVIVSTDDAEIAGVAREFGAITPFVRPAELASDTAAEWASWRHAVNHVQDHLGPFDIFASLPATSPFRNVTDVKTCVDVLKNDAQADIVITGRDAERSPYFNMVQLDEQNYAHLAIQPPANIVRRQDAPALFDVTTVAYVARPGFVLGSSKLWDGSVRMVKIPAERALDIDTPHDFFIGDCIARAFPGIHLT